MTINADWAELVENNEIAFLKADVCLGSPESFSLEEKASICDEMEATNKAIEDAIRRDFEAMPPEFQARLLDMLCASGCMTPEYGGRTRSSVRCPIHLTSCKRQLLGTQDANRPRSQSVSGAASCGAPTR